MKIIALSWHPDDYNVIASGGYRRFIEIAKRWDTKLTIIDKYPSIYRQIFDKNVEIIEYKVVVPKIIKLTNPIIAKLIDRTITTIALLKALLMLYPSEYRLYVPFSEIVELTVPAVVFKLLSHCKVTFCNLNVNTYPFDSFINRITHKFADHVITISSGLKSDLRSAGIIVNNINGVGFDLPDAPFKKHLKKYDAIFVGRHIPQKGIIDLIEIWNILINTYVQKVILITAGDVPQFMAPKIHRLINKYNLQSYIKISGLISDTKRNELIGSSRLFVFPSHQEGWGIAPMEALAFGLPVIVYNLPIYSESLGNSPAIIYIPESDKLQFAKSIVDSLSNKNLAQAALKWKPKADWNTISRMELSIIQQ